ncbi:hypothetical protein [Mycoplasmopsis felifaucium]|uniref:Uncharacterized protein n=1 Tax=Mycoplasmopsis felifaucium TaxID=35768 RepID=A0ABZ2RV04_9BACT
MSKKIKIFSGTVIATGATLVGASLFAFIHNKNNQKQNNNDAIEMQDMLNRLVRQSENALILNNDKEPFVEALALNEAVNLSKNKPTDNNDYAQIKDLHDNLHNKLEKFIEAISKIKNNKPADSSENVDGQTEESNKPTDSKYDSLIAKQNELKDKIKSLKETPAYSKISGSLSDLLNDSLDLSKFDSEEEINSEIQKINDELEKAKESVDNLEVPLNNLDELINNYSNLFDELINDNADNKYDRFLKGTKNILDLLKSVRNNPNDQIVFEAMNELANNKFDTEFNPNNSTSLASQVKEIANKIHQANEALEALNHPDITYPRQKLINAINSARETIKTGNKKELQNIDIFIEEAINSYRYDYQQYLYNLNSYKYNDVEEYKRKVAEIKYLLENNKSKSDNQKTDFTALIEKVENELPNFPELTINDPYELIKNKLNQATQFYNEVQTEENDIIQNEKTAFKKLKDFNGNIDQDWEFSAVLQGEKNNVEFKELLDKYKEVKAEVETTLNHNYAYGYEYNIDPKDLHTFDKYNDLYESLTNSQNDFWNAIKTKKNELYAEIQRLKDEQSVIITPIINDTYSQAKQDYLYNTLSAYNLQNDNSISINYMQNAINNLNEAYKTFNERIQEQQHNLIENIKKYGAIRRFLVDTKEKFSSNEKLLDGHYFSSYVEGILAKLNQWLSSYPEISPNAYLEDNTVNINKINSFIDRLTTENLNDMFYTLNNLTDRMYSDSHYVMSLPDLFKKLNAVSQKAINIYSITSKIANGNYIDVIPKLSAVVDESFDLAVEYLWATYARYYQSSWSSISPSIPGGRSLQDKLNSLLNKYYNPEEFLKYLINDIKNANEYFAEIFTNEDLGLTAKEMYDLVLTHLNDDVIYQKLIDDLTTLNGTYLEAEKVFKKYESDTNKQNEIDNHDSLWTKFVAEKTKAEKMFKTTNLESDVILNINSELKKLTDEINQLNLSTTN